MSGPLRSKQGCWTCRLRKKKCDEERPLCSTCESLSIICYGYGTKPDWMKNSENARAVANSLKEIVKHTSRRKDTSQFAKRCDPVIRIAPKSSNAAVENSTVGPGLDSQYGITLPVSPQLDQRPSNEYRLNMLQDTFDNPPSPEIGEKVITGSIFSLSGEESISLMHFLDDVFPLQYPIYKPKVREGGRGWLLTLLLDTKPLYHAALALSAYHRRTIQVANLGRPSCRASAVVQQSKHLGTCIESVQQFVQNPGRNIGAGIVTSVVQLVFFELFTGYGKAWQAHLLAAMTIFQQAYVENLLHFGLAEMSRTILCGNLSLPEYDPLVTQEVVTFRFMSGTIIWLDIISSITSGTAPRLLPYHSFVIAPDSQTKLEDIMGCKNSVMLQIGRIAALYERRIQALGQHFDCKEFGQTVGDIGGEIQHVLTQSALEGFNISQCDSSPIFHAMLDPPTLVTCMFAHMATIYLHLVVHGFQKLEALDTTISEALGILQTQIPRNLLSGLVAPLYFIGSVASQRDEQFFRDMLSSAPLLDPLLKHRGKILPSLEEIWSKRRIIPGLSWKDGLALAYDVLLI